MVLTFAYGLVIGVWCSHLGMVLSFGCFLYVCLSFGYSVEYGPVMFLIWVLS